jgi:hypothetical protein
MKQLTIIALGLLLPSTNLMAINIPGMKPATQSATPKALDEFDEIVTCDICYNLDYVTAATKDMLDNDLLDDKKACNKYIDIVFTAFAEIDPILKKIIAEDQLKPNAKHTKIIKRLVKSRQMLVGFIAYFIKYIASQMPQRGFFCCRRKNPYGGKEKWAQVLTDWQEVESRCFSYPVAKLKAA